jgi:hypothetical protein
MNEELRMSPFIFHELKFFIFNSKFFIDFKLELFDNSQIFTKQNKRRN